MERRWSRYSMRWVSLYLAFSVAALAVACSGPLESEPQPAPPEDSPPEEIAPEPLRGWAGEYRGVGAIIYKSWATFESQYVGIEPFSRSDTIKFDAPATLVMDSLSVVIRFDDGTIKTTVQGGSIYPHYVGDTVFSLTQFLSMNTSVNCRFTRTEDKKVVTGSISERAHRFSAPVHSQTTTSIKAVKTEVLHE